MGKITSGNVTSVRNFEVNDIVYLYSLMKKPGRGLKFWKPWTGPYKIAACLAKLDCRIVNPQGKEFVV